MPESYGGVALAHDDENDATVERRALLPQHAAAWNASTSPVRRRGGGGAGAPTASNGHADEGKYDKIPAAWSRSNGSGVSQSIARIGRSTSIDDGGGAYATNPDFDDRGGGRGGYYYDDTNDYSWDCTFGTDEGSGIWLNTLENDPPGTAMSIIVWVLFAYSAVTVTLLARSSSLSHGLAYFYCTICAMALASHAKTMFTDPGSVPSCAVPVDAANRQTVHHSMCRVCKSYKPPMSHHCRICNRCVSRMDHHCPWMNNCIGAANLKPFILFLSYTWAGSALALMIFGCNYFFCSDEDCQFPGMLVQLVRVMTLLCTGALLFTSSMLANVTFGVMTGSGTIDRLKRKFDGTIDNADEAPLDLVDVFGIGGYATWFLPVDPIFPDHDKVLGFSVPQRLLREGNENTSIC
ncbi:hypothetical protein ACHAXT_002477 [Thalassiosira profunda]